MEVLKVDNITVEVGDNIILKDFNLTINKGEIHVLMGKNGSGKSTLLNVLMGNPEYSIVKGKIFFLGEDITELSADKRAKMGMFLSFQNPEEIDGVKTNEFLRIAKSKITGGIEDIFTFSTKYSKAVNNLDIDPALAKRYLNVGFSGGEKKKNEVLQLRMLDPKFAMLDEIDSGLDVEAVKVVSRNINEYFNEEKAMLIVSHHTEILNSVNADFVHVLVNGKIVKTGDNSLIQEVQEKGYNF